MSLIKQLWLAVIFLMAVVFVGSFVVSCLSTKHYLEAELYKKNIDNASMIALSLTSQASDPLMMELFINSQFDTGHYQFISLIDMDGNIIAGQKNQKNNNKVPSWLPTLFPVQAKPGYAQVSDGWKRVATLILSTDSDFVYLQLWDNAKYLFYYFVLIALSTCVLGSIILRRLTAPLHLAVHQAEAIGERRFILTDEPKTLEFRAVIRSLNKLSERVKTIITTETEKLESLQKKIQYDPVSTLFSREAILGVFSSYLERDNEYSNGVVVLIRIHDLQNLNKSKGREIIDGLLYRIGLTLNQIGEESEQTPGRSGRLNGSDFLVIAPALRTAKREYGKHIMDQIKRCCLACSMPEIKVYGASTAYLENESASGVLTRLDSILLTAPDIDTASCIYLETDLKLQKIRDNIDWQKDLTNAFLSNSFSLEFYPVHDIYDNILHLEAPVRLRNNYQNLINAAQFIPHINRFKLGSQLDILVTQLALEHIKETNLAIGINISATILGQPKAMHKLISIIKENSKFSELLWLEIPEYGVFQNLQGFREFSKLLKPLACKFGLDHVGHEVSCIGELHDLGIDFVKIDSSFIRDIDTNNSGQIFLQGLTTIVHSLGINVIAQGVETREEWSSLMTLGFDGATGTYFT